MTRAVFLDGQHTKTSSRHISVIKHLMVCAREQADTVSFHSRYTRARVIFSSFKGLVRALLSRCPSLRATSEARDASSAAWRRHSSRASSGVTGSGGQLPSDVFAPLRGSENPSRQPWGSTSHVSRSDMSAGLPAPPPGGNSPFSIQPEGWRRIEKASRST